MPRPISEAKLRRKVSVVAIAIVGNSDEHGLVCGYEDAEEVGGVGSHK